MKTIFKPFKLKIEVNSLEQLEALWLMANSNSSLEDFLNSHVHKADYIMSETLSTPIGGYWSKLNKHLKKYNTNLNKS